MSTVPAVLAVDGVSRWYAAGRREVLAVDRASLAVSEGEIVGISGASGSGKSTLLRLLGGIERPDEGVVAFGGAPAWPRPSARWACYPRPGYVMPIFQDPAASLDARWPIWRSLTEPVGRDHSRAEREAMTRSWLERAAMAHVDPAARPHELSGGQCQRVAILRALIARPALLVADEPTARQDVITAGAITELLEAAVRAGSAIVVVSHDTTWLDTFAHRVLAMREGVLAET